MTVGLDVFTTFCSKRLFLCYSVSVSKSLFLCYSVVRQGRIIQFTMSIIDAVRVYTAVQVFLFAEILPLPEGILGVV